MAKRDEEGLLELLVELPWWVSVLIAASVFVGLKVAAPAIASRDMFFQGQLPYEWFGALFLLPAAVSALNASRKRKLLDTQTGIESIRSLGWKQFEELLAEAYRRQGYTVQENRTLGADGGIDIVLRKDGCTYLFQCKQWRSYKVGVKVVREMLGLVSAHRARAAIVVTSGVFTKEAAAFAERQPVELIDGPQLARLIRSAQTGTVLLTPRSPEAAAPGPAPRVCPKCGGSLVLRTARRGAKAGGSFFGCSNYPRCRHTEEIAG